jgi:small subunit ribosomal protein S8
MMTDPVADMLTRIRNASRIERPLVDVAASRLKIGVAEVLKNEGYVYAYQVGVEVPDEQGHPSFQETQGPIKGKGILRIFLKYGSQGERVIQHLQRVSKPGCRIYRGYKELRPVLDGLGIAIVSTSQGVLSDRQARAKKLGGELLCTVW